MSNAASPDVSAGHDQVPRRGALARLAAWLGYVVVWALSGTVSALPFLAPARRSRPQGGSGAEGRSPFVPVATLDQVPDDGRPRRFAVVADRHSAWTRVSGQVIGSVYLVRQPGQSVPRALHSRCPHAGCTVGLVPDQPEVPFRCPCHRSLFRADGTRVTPSPSPRDMDPLECKVVQGRVMVRFQNYALGLPQRIPET